MVYVFIHGLFYAYFLHQAQFSCAIWQESGCKNFDIYDARVQYYYPRDNTEVKELQIYREEILGHLIREKTGNGRLISINKKISLKKKILLMGNVLRSYGIPWSKALCVMLALYANWFYLAYKVVFVLKFLFPLRIH